MDHSLLANNRVNSCISVCASDTTCASLWCLKEPTRLCCLVGCTYGKSHVWLNSLEVILSCASENVPTASVCRLQHALQVQTAWESTVLEQLTSAQLTAKTRDNFDLCVACMDFKEGFNLLFDNTKGIKHSYSVVLLAVCFTYTIWTKVTGHTL